MKKTISLFLLAICCAQLSHTGRKPPTKKGRSLSNPVLLERTNHPCESKETRRLRKQLEYMEKQKHKSDKLKAKSQKALENYKKQMAIWSKNLKN